MSTLMKEQVGARTVAPRVQLGAWSAWTWVRMGLLALAFVALYFRWMDTQYAKAMANVQDWGHTLIMPLIGGYLLWSKRRELAKLDARTFWPGVLPLVLGIGSYFYFIVGVANHMLQGFAMVLTLAGLTLLVGGLAVFRLAFLPIALLVFSVEISEQIMIKVTFPLQVISSQGAYFILRLISLPRDWFMVDLDGNTLRLFNRTSGEWNAMGVAEACSGLRMLVAFLALGAIVGILSCRHWWQRITLLLLAAPVAILLNIVRVAALGVASLWNVSLASGDAHMLIGTLLLVPGLGLFLSVVWALNRAVGEASPGVPGAATSAETPKGARA